jgi:hypothetical protein
MGLSCPSHQYTLLSTCYGARPRDSYWRQRHGSGSGESSWRLDMGDIGMWAVIIKYGYYWASKSDCKNSELDSQGKCPIMLMQSWYAICWANGHQSPGGEGSNMSLDRPSKLSTSVQAATDSLGGTSPLSPIPQSRWLYKLRAGKEKQGSTNHK